MRSHLPGYEYIAMYSKYWTRNTEFLVSKRSAFQRTSLSFLIESFSKELLKEIHVDLIET